MNRRLAADATDDLWRKVRAGADLPRATGQDTGLTQAKAVFEARAK